MPSLLYGAELWVHHIAEAVPYADIMPVFCE